MAEGVRGGGCVCGRGACVVGGCVAGGHAWWGACVAGGHAWWGGVHDKGHVWQGGMHGGGICVAGGHAWQGVCMTGGGMHVGGHVWWGACVAGGACMALRDTVGQCAAVRILLECILVNCVVFQRNTTKQSFFRAKAMRHFDMATILVTWC